MKLELEEAHANFTQWFSSQGGPVEMMVVGMWHETDFPDDEGDGDDDVELVPHVLVITAAPTMLELCLANFIAQFGGGAPTRVFVHLPNVVDDSVNVDTYLTLVTILIEEVTDFHCQCSALITKWNPVLESFEEMTEYDQGRVMYAIEEQRSILISYMDNISNRKLAANASMN